VCEVQKNRLPFGAHAKVIDYAKKLVDVFAVPLARALYRRTENTVVCL